MKKLLLLLIILTSLNNYSQERKYNFILNEDKTVSWQKIFELEGNKEQLKEKLNKFLKKQQFTSELKSSKNEFNGTSVKTNVRVKRGKKYINSNDFTCYIRIELKENKFRVTIKDIKFEPITGGINTGGIIMTTNQAYSFGYFTVKDSKNEFRKNKPIQDMIKSFDSKFVKYFTYSEGNKLDDW